MKIKILIVFLLITFTYYSCSEKEIERSNGIMVDSIPTQSLLENIEYINKFEDYKIRKVANYSIDARVLRKEKYTTDRASDLSPFDFALGWQEMSSNELLNILTIKQSNRFYFWRTNEKVFPRKTIETKSANTHIIPDTEEIYDEMKSVRKGSIVKMSGYLVSVESLKDGWYWKTSTTRNDTGNGACEILYVTKFEIVG